MEFERTIFRIYERVLSVVNPHKLLIFSGGLAGVSVFSLVMLAVLHSLFVNSGQVLADAISEQLLNSSTKYSTPLFNLTLGSDEELYTGDLVLLQEDLYIIKLGDLTYKFSALPQSSTISDEIFQRHNFTQHNLTLSINDFVPGYFSWLLTKTEDWDTIMVNQVSTLYSPYQGYLKNMKTEEIWIWHKGEVQQFNDPAPWTLAFRLLRAFGSYVLISNITALMCRVSIISSAAVLISLQTCCGLCARSENTQLMLFYSFPWIGQNLYALRNSGRMPAAMLTAYFTMFMSFYFMYACCYFVWTLLVFNHILPEGLDDNFFTLINTLEFFSLIFVRAKRSVAYFPRGICCAVILFVLYRFNHFYGFLGWAYLALVFACLAMMCATVAVFEHAALFGLARPPTYDTPRLVYQPLLRSNAAVPELWTVFYPSHSASHFTAREMQLVHPVT